MIVFDCRERCRLRAYEISNTYVFCDVCSDDEGIDSDEDDEEEGDEDEEEVEPTEDQEGDVINDLEIKGISLTPRPDAKVSSVIFC